MYDFINGKHWILSAVEEAAILFGMDPYQIREVVAKQELFYMKHILIVGRDIRFPTEEQRKSREEGSKNLEKILLLLLVKGLYYRLIGLEPQMITRNIGSM